jgi:hypothetical protein
MSKHTCEWCKKELPGPVPNDADIRLYYCGDQCRQAHKDFDRKYD